jgi:hypothetical protein
MPRHRRPRISKSAAVREGFGHPQVGPPCAPIVQRCPGRWTRSALAQPQVGGLTGGVDLHTAQVRHGREPSHSSPGGSSNWANVQFTVPSGRAGSWQVMLASDAYTHRSRRGHNHDAPGSVACLDGARRAVITTRRAGMRLYARRRRPECLSAVDGESLGGHADQSSRGAAREFEEELFVAGLEFSLRARQCCSRVRIPPGDFPSGPH